MKTLKKLTALIIAFSLALLSSVPAFAQELQTHSYLKKSFVNLNINSETAEKLAKKIEDGKQLDSMNPKYNYIKPSKIIRDDGYYYERTEYPDGSVNVVRVSSGTFNGKISGGDYNSGTYWYTWNNARVFATWGAVTMSYRANFEGGKGFGKIHKVYNDSVTTIGGTFKNKSLKINRANATQSASAKASLYIYFSGYQDTMASDVRLWLYVPYNGSEYAKISTLA